MGWPSLIVSIYFIGGVIISILGVIGIYLGKTFDETKKRPLYIVREITFSETIRSAPHSVDRQKSALVAGARDH